MSRELFLMTDATSSSTAASFFSKFRKNYTDKKPETMSLGAYLERCKDDKMAYANPVERLLDAIGEPEYIDTAQDKGRLGRIFQGRTIARYPSFSDFYGAERTIEKIVSFVRGAAEGTEYSKQVLYLLGPVGGGKSSLGDRLKELMEKHPIYVLRSRETGELSPIHESPLALFNDKEMDEEMRQELTEIYGIPERYRKVDLSPWAVKRLKEADGDVDAAFEVVKIYPSERNRIAVAKVEPGDDNNQDVSVLVGKVNINKLGEETDQNDTDTYLYSGGFSIGNQGLMEFVEMFKAPLKVLNPMLEALQSGEYQGTENIGAIPFQGIVIAHSNESEWQSFCADKKNEALLDRINLIHVPYTLQMTEEAQIYQKMLNQSGYVDHPMAPKTIETLAAFTVMSRLSDAEGVGQYDHHIRSKVLDGQLPDEATAKVPTITELKQLAPLEEGMSGISTRFAFKTLTETFNKNANEGEIAADPLLLMEVLAERIREDGRISAEQEEKLTTFIADKLMPEYMEDITKEIVSAFTGTNDDMCQNMFDRYVDLADSWIHNETFNDKSLTGRVLNRNEIDKKLKELEAPAKISNPEDFRNEVVGYVHRLRARGETVEWNSYEKLAHVIRTNLSRTMKDLLPVIQLDTEPTDERIADKRNSFFKNMEEKGFTDRMTRRVVSAYQMTL